MVSYLISFEDLPDELTPEELRVFSNPVRRQPIILSQLAGGQSTPILEAILDLYESEVLNLMAIKQETINRLVEAVGREKILATFRKEDLLATFRKEDLVAALSKEDLLAALNKEDVLRQLLAELGPDQLRQMIDQISRN
jgi:hypothetical protein